MKNIIKDLLALSPRQDENLKKTEGYILSYLKRRGVKTYVETFSVVIPQITKATLMADGKNIVCLGCSFVGGKITSKDNILSSTISSRYNIELPNINFNPYSPKICRNNFYFAPAVAIARADVAKVAKAKKVVGEVVVKKFKGNSSHVLAGNKRDPKNIVFAHYDAIGSGAIDNASGVAACLYLIKNFPETLANTLFVFDGNEELSYDFPTYWGHGFRVFEKRHKALLEKAEKIIAVDCVGNGPTTTVSDINILKYAFPIENLLKWSPKISTMYGDIPKLMKVYHSDSDNLGQLDEKFLRQAVKVLRQKLV